MGVRSRIVKTLDRLEQQLYDWQQNRRKEEDRESAEQRRWEETCYRFFEVLPEDLWDRVRTALDDNHCPLRRWLDNIFRGRSRLPDCLTEEVMRRLVEVRLSEGAASSDFHDGVCLRCGLQYPLPNYPPSAQCDCSSCADGKRRRAESLALFERLFDRRGCPACGASTKAGEMNWAHLMEDGFWTTDRHDRSEDKGAAEKTHCPC
jgi:hypothetical protein